MFLRNGKSTEPAANFKNPLSFRIPSMRKPGLTDGPFPAIHSFLDEAYPPLRCNVDPFSYAVVYGMIKPEFIKPILSLMAS